eukprot:4424920-Pyramimonas_sp.AAC.1
MASKMAQGSRTWLNIASDMPRIRLKTAPRLFRVPFEPSSSPRPPQEAKMAPQSREHHFWLPSRLIPSDGSRRP